MAGVSGPARTKTRSRSGWAGRSRARRRPACASSTNARADGRRWRSRCQTTAIVRGGTSSSRRAHALVLLVDGQPRDDGGAQAGSDHPLHGPVVVGAEDEAARLGEKLSSWFARGSGGSRSGRAPQRRRASSCRGRPRRPGGRARRVAQHLRCSKGPSGSGRSAKVRSSSPRSICPSSSTSFAASSSETSTRGQPSTKRDISWGGCAGRRSGRRPCGACRPGRCRGRPCPPGPPRGGRRSPRRGGAAARPPRSATPCAGPRAARELLADDPLEGRDLLADRRLRIPSDAARPNDASRETASSAIKWRSSTPSQRSGSIMERYQNSICANGSPCRYWMSWS